MHTSYYRTDEVCCSVHVFGRAMSIYDFSRFSLCSSLNWYSKLGIGSPSSLRWCDRSCTLQGLSADVYKYYLAIEMDLYFSFVMANTISRYRTRESLSLASALSPIGQRQVIIPPFVWGSFGSDRRRIYPLHPHLIWCDVL